MSDKNVEFIELPFRKQVFGGFRQADVVSYIEEMTVSIEEEQKRLELEKNELYELMKDGRDFSNKLIADAQKQADEILEAAQQKADQKLKIVKEDVAYLSSERTRILAACHAEADNLVTIFSNNHSAIEKAYEKLAEPLMEFSRLTGVKSNDA